MVWRETWHFVLPFTADISFGKFQFFHYFCSQINLTVSLSRNTSILAKVPEGITKEMYKIPYF
jgi:hypothetical protein